MNPTRSLLLISLFLLATALQSPAAEHKAADEEKPAPTHGAKAEAEPEAEHGAAAELPHGKRHGAAKSEEAASEKLAVRKALAKKAAAERAEVDRAMAERAAAEKEPEEKPAIAKPTVAKPVKPHPVHHVSRKPRWIHAVHAAPAMAPARVAGQEPAGGMAPVAMLVPGSPAAVAGVRPEAGHPPHWSYEGANGPAAWAQLSPEFAKCGNGARQSPIDIREGIKLELEPIQFEYRQSAFQVIDNGHTVQASVSPGNFIRIMGRRFQLIQFHFHRPSEELIDGRPAEMEMHMVHKDSDGKLAVVAVLLERGIRQPVIQTVWNNLPLEKNEEVAASTRIDPNQLLPENKKYFVYMGSLTTPPCTEGVLWVVMKQPMQLSPDQIELFARLYPMNARPVQAAAGRLIKESN